MGLTHKWEVTSDTAGTVYLQSEEGMQNMTNGDRH